MPRPYLTGMYRSQYCKDNLKQKEHIQSSKDKIEIKMLKKKSFNKASFFFFGFLLFLSAKERSSISFDKRVSVHNMYKSMATKTTVQYFPLQ